MTPTIGKRLVALAKDPDVPRWCKVAFVIGAAIPSPLEIDDAIIGPIILVYLWMRHRHLLVRHGISGANLLACGIVMVLVIAAIGETTDLMIGMFT